MLFCPFNFCLSTVIFLFLFFHLILYFSFLFFSFDYVIQLFSLIFETVIIKWLPLVASTALFSAHAYWNSFMLGLLMNMIAHIKWHAMPHIRNAYIQEGTNLYQTTKNPVNFTSSSREKNRASFAVLWHGVSFWKIVSLSVNFGVVFTQIHQFFFFFLVLKNENKWKFCIWGFEHNQRVICEQL